MWCCIVSPDSTAVSNKGLSMEFRTEARFASVAYLLFLSTRFHISFLDLISWNLEIATEKKKSIINSCYSLERCQWKINGLFCNYRISSIDELLSALGFPVKRPIWSQNLKIGECLRHHLICIWRSLRLSPLFSGACSLPLPWLTSGHHPLTPDFVLCVPFGELGWSVAWSALPPLTLEPRWPWDHIGCNFSVYFWTGKNPLSVRSGFPRAA